LFFYARDPMLSLVSIQCNQIVNIDDLGFGQQFVLALPAKIGALDVDDSLHALQHALHSHSFIDPQRVNYYGTFCLDLLLCRASKLSCDGQRRRITRRFHRCEIRSLSSRKLHF
jgi:hypothetical protein